MDKEIKNIEKKDKIIDLFDMFWAIIYQWKILLLCAIIGFVGFTSLKVVKNYNHIRNNEAKVEAYKEKSKQYKKNKKEYDKELDTFYKEKEVYEKANAKYEKEFKSLMKKNEIYNAYKLRLDRPIAPKKPKEPKEPKEPKITEIGMTYGLVKYSLVGMVGGLLAGAIVVCGYYVINKKIKTKEELEEVYSLRIFDYLVSDGKKRNPISSKIRELRYRNVLTKEEHLGLVITNLVITCKRNHYAEVFLTSSIDLSKNDKNQIAVIIKGLREEGIVAAYGNNVNTDVSSMKTMDKMNNVVIVEKIGKTSYPQLEEELTLCTDLNINLLGIIPIVEER